MSSRFLYIIFISFALFSCKSKVSVDGNLKTANFISLKAHQTSYDFTQPKLFELERSLEEISGLTYDSIEKVLWTHNDEEGVIFKLNPKNGKVLDKVSFAKSGDYEGITLYQDQIVIVNSSGNLFFYDPKTQETQKVKTDLGKRNNVEGLTYDAHQNVLLLACKGEPIDYDKDYPHKAIYSFDLSSNKLDAKPYMEISEEALMNYLAHELEGQNMSDKQKENLEKRLKAFAPSGIEIHPESRDIYIISARGGTLVVFDTDKQIKQLIFLDKKALPQAEGISFDADHLYISSEMKGIGGRILKFKRP
ncbi:SdiA-regulated domain-containing protein [Profundicola chukchiensis]|nr:SdiA-regulated domain-containing protein [Profundicola chukchiensis]